MEMQEYKRPPKPQTAEYYFDAFSNGRVLENKKQGRLPAMGWNSWNAFGSNNTEALTQITADRMVELGLDELGYEYVVLDDGCYLPERVDGKLKNEPVKFPSGFETLADYVHGKGLKFGMYNDIGSNLCAGAAVGTCGHELEDAKSYVNWGVDFLKVDNCYYLWDNATFSDAKNAKYVYGPKIRKICITASDEVISEKEFSEEEFMQATNQCGIGTYDGTGPERTPIGSQSEELVMEVVAPATGMYEISMDCTCGEEVACGSWIQVKVESDETGNKEAEKGVSEENCVKTMPIYDDFVNHESIKIKLEKGKNRIRLMNHRRQENTLLSYATFLSALNQANPNHDIVLSICEWGKTQPQNWGYKVGASWRILNDITFRVGNDGDPGHGDWTSDYTTGVAVQYNKAVIMDEFAGLDKGWNDPDMLMIGMDGLDMTMNRTHMTMWCMLNSPLMLGLDLRRVEKGDDLWNIIANKDLIALNQDSLGVQAKRVKVYQEGIGRTQGVDQDYIRDNDRVDILAKPLADGSVAVSFINLSEEDKKGPFDVTVIEIMNAIGHKLGVGKKKDFVNATQYLIVDLWSKEEKETSNQSVSISTLKAHDQVTIKILPLEKSI